MKKNVIEKLKDELSVGLSINHGQYQTSIDELEYKIDSNVRLIEDLEEKREKIEGIRLAKHLEQKQVEKLGSLFIVKLKDSVLFFLILFVLSLLATEVYRIGASGSGAEVQLVVEEGTIIDVQIINGGSEYEAVEISTPSKTVDSAIFEVIIQSRQIEKIDIVHGGSGYSNDVKPIVRPTFANSTLWMFWIIDTVCCVLFLLNFFFELRLCDSKKWYWKTHWVDFVTSIPLPPLHLIFVGSGSLNAVRAGRVLRVVRILRAVRIFKNVFIFMAWHGSPIFHYGC